MIQMETKVKIIKSVERGGKMIDVAPSYDMNLSTIIMSVDSVWIFISHVKFQRFHITHYNLGILKGTQDRTFRFDTVWTCPTCDSYTA